MQEKHLKVIDTARSVSHSAAKEQEFGMATETINNRRQQIGHDEATVTMDIQILDGKENVRFNPLQDLDLTNEVANKVASDTSPKK